MFRCLLITACCGLAAATVLADDAKQVFDALYAAKIRQVTATADRADDVALAKEIMSVASTSGATPLLQALFCEAVYDLGMRHADGYAHAAAAMRLLADSSPQQRTAAREKLVALYTRQMSTGAAADRDLAADALVQVMIESGDERMEAKQFSAAVSDFRRALATATSRKSPLMEDVKNRLDAAMQHDRIQRQIARLEERLLEDATAATVADELIRLHVVELDDPTEAQRFLNRSKDATLQRLVPLAAADEDKLTGEQLFQLGEWYRGLATATGPAQRGMLDRSERYFSRFLQIHTDEDITRTKATLILKEIRAMQAKLAPNPLASSTRPKPRAAQEIVLEGVIDGRSDLIVTPKGLSWVHYDWDKPHSLTVNGKPWALQWSRPAPNAREASNLFPLSVEFVDVRIERLGGPGDNRGHITPSVQKDAATITVHDHQNGPGGYKFKLILRTEEDLADELIGEWTQSEKTMVITVSRRGKAWAVTGSQRSEGAEIGSYRLTDVKFERGVLKGRQLWIKNPLSYGAAESVEIKMEGDRLRLDWKTGDRSGYNHHDRVDAK